jgi:hypothetical protein
MLHRNSTLNHKIENWTYADAAARTAATGFVASDVGKLAFQIDNSSYWRLMDESPITWAQAMAGPAGADGADGATGSVWRNGSGVPSNALGVDNDYYVNTDNGNVYFKAAGTYSLILNITGPAGADGADGADATGPAGGATNQVLAKTSNADGAYDWRDDRILPVANVTSDQASTQTDGSAWTLTGDPLAKLTATGLKMFAKWGFSIVGHATATRGFDVYIGATQIWVYTPRAFVANSYAEIDLMIVRTGTSTARFVLKFTTSDGTIDVLTGTVTGLTFSSGTLNTNVYVGGTGAAAGDVKMTIGTVYAQAA